MEDSRFQNLKEFVLGNLTYSNSQLQQDLVSHFFSSLDNYSNQPVNKFFVEIGANDGISLSNTFALERNFGWRGILSEANPNLLQELKSNRVNSIVDSRAVDLTTGTERAFLISKESEYSSLKNASVHIDKLVSALEVKVSTVTLTDLLHQLGAPQFIDFLSIDTEGNELDIIQSLDFSIYEFRFIAIEVTRNAPEISKILLEYGYVQILSEISAWDQWWLNGKLYESIQ